MRVTSFVAALALLATVTFAQTITFDFDKSADFARFKTYAWVRGANLPDAFNHERILSAVNAQLGSKGLTLVGRDGDPDLYVAYHASFERDLQITGFGSGWGGYRIPGNYSGRTEQILKGTLIVDLVNAKTRTIVWRGMAEKDVDVKAKPEQRDRNINQAAEKMFKNYPPAK